MPRHRRTLDAPSLVEALLAELRRQNDDPDQQFWVLDDDSPGHVEVDGYLDVTGLVQVVDQFLERMKSVNARGAGK